MVVIPVPLQRPHTVFPCPSHHAHNSRPGAAERAKHRTNAIVQAANVLFMIIFISRRVSVSPDGIDFTHSYLL